MMTQPCIRYVPKLELHVWVVHLHAHSSSIREKESRMISTFVQLLVANNSKVVLMGE